MGNSVSIRELAEQMIRFYGFEPGTDIPITYTGLRKGEKVLEKLYAETEVPEQTEHPKILKLHRKTLINGRINSVLDRLRPICFFDPADAEVFRNRRVLRSVLEEVIPGIGPAREEPEF
jgi:FlaA1/EpsC-like NDP-sugar epimerase